MSEDRAAEAPAPSPDDDARAAAVAFAHGMQTFWDDRIGPRLLGVYLIGSLAHGGFNRRYSDIDMALIAEDGLRDDDLAAMRTAAAKLAPDLAPKLSLFWTDRSFTIGRFPPLDRGDMLDCPVVLTERESVRPQRPTLEEVRGYLADAPFAGWVDRVARFAAIDTLEPSDYKPYLKAHLYPARLNYSWQTGKMASNDVAVDFTSAQPPDGLDVGLLIRALDIRHRAADPDSLFADRVSLPSQVEACARLMAG